MTQAFTFDWDGMDVLVISLWALRADDPSVIEECAGHVSISLFKLKSGVPEREPHSLLCVTDAVATDFIASDAAGAVMMEQSVNGAVEVELYYTHNVPKPISAKKKNRRVSALK